MLIAMMWPQRLIGRQAQKGRIVDIDVAAVHVGKDVVRLNVAHLPEVGVGPEQGEAERLDKVVEPTVGSQSLVRRIMRDIDREKQRRRAEPDGEQL